MLEKTNQVNLLFDFYAPLLKGKQREYLELYYLDDLSLSEIAEMHEVSRQAVYDHIKRAEKQLFEYEQKLRLAERHEKRLNVLNQMRELVSELADSEARDELNTLLHQLSEMD
ncbi:putative DNA-binding protein [Brevibacillus sp. GCM10020057]|uniref:putative DNA-binding protein n=1 Tax=Brevibacillus sp. GCM10020057 TaxID=3317327 RepID=UPI003634DBAE